MTFGRLLLLFILVPIAELALLIEIGKRLGLPATLALIVVTGALGATLARRQGLSVLASIRSETEAGRLPAGQLVDGAIILVAGAVLMTPGVLTDAFGFACLIPGMRNVFKRWLNRRFEGAIEQGRVHVSTGPDSGSNPFRPPGGMRDVTPREPVDRTRVSGD